MLANSSSCVRSLRSHEEMGAPGCTSTGRAILAKPIISTSMFHRPSAKSAKRNIPSWSVVVVTFLSPWTAETVTPGTGRFPDLTAPRYSDAISTDAAVMQTRAARHGLGILRLVSIYSIITEKGANRCGLRRVLTLLYNDLQAEKLCVGRFC